MGTVLRFDVFEFDTHALELRRAGALVYLRPQPGRLLRALAKHPGVLLTRDELRDQLWPAGMFVRFDQGLNSCMKRVRAALGDQHERPRFIETLPRRGYRFLLPVSDPSAAIAASRRVRLAVLPFKAIDAGSDPARPLVTDGFADELTSQLAGQSPGHAPSDTRPHQDDRVDGDVAANRSEPRALHDFVAWRGARGTVRDLGQK